MNHANNNINALQTVYCWIEIKDLFCYLFEKVRSLSHRKRSVIGEPQLT